MSVTQLTKGNLFAMLLIPFVWIYELSVVVPVLGLLGVAFPSASQFQIQLVFCAPLLTSVIFSIISGKLVKFLDKKTIVLVGLFIYGVVGILPAFAESIPQIILLRLLMGVGVGLVLPMPNAYIAEYFTGEKRAKMLGFATAVANVANIAANLIVGVLIMYGWQYAFSAFTIVLVIMVVAMVFLPKSPPLKQLEQKNKAELKISREKLPRIIYTFFVLMVFNWVFFAFITVNCPFFFTEHELGTPLILAIALMFPATGSMIAGLVYSTFQKLFKGLLPFISLVIFGSAFAIYLFADSFILVCLGNFLVGFGSGLIVPLLLDLTARRTKPEQRDMAFGIVSAGMHLGPLLFPFVQLGIATLGQNQSLIFLHTVSLCVMILAALISLVSFRKSHDQELSV